MRLERQCRTKMFRTSWRGSPRSDPRSARVNRRNSMNEAGQPSRRGMLLKLGLLLNGAAGVVLAVPIVRYLLSPLIRDSGASGEQWLSLGSLDHFPAGQTRLATYRN